MQKINFIKKGSEKDDSQINIHKYLFPYAMFSSYLYYHKVTILKVWCTVGILECALLHSSYYDII